ncbi:46533_t:CDS:2, partial [Gigaspora margarita]
NQLALKLTITELAHDNHIVLPNAICDTINNENFWEDVESLLTILDKLVAGIATFESDTPKLALFYNWYHDQLEIKTLLENQWKKLYQSVMSVAHLLDPRFYRKKLSANSILTISMFIQKYYLNKADIIWRQLLQYKTRTVWNAVDEVDLIAWWKGNFKESASELCKVASRILNIPSLSAAANKPSNKINKFELLDPDSDEYEKLVESNSEIETVELSESEIESATESDMDNESE